MRRAGHAPALREPSASDAEAGGVPPSLLGGGAVRRRLQRQTRVAGQPLAFLPHFESALLHRRQNLGDFASVEVGSDARIAGPHDHRRQFARLKLLERPGERVLDKGPVPVDAVVLVARAVVVMRAVPEVVEGKSSVSSV